MQDLISRQAALEVIGAVFPVDPMKSEYAQGIACGAALAKTYVEQLPSAQPDLSEYSDKLWRNAYERGKRDAQTERPKGEWIDNETSYADGVRQTCTCSVCGIRSVRPLGDFCRWCGADMRGQQDE